MENVLKQITAIDGVIGSTLYDRKGEILAAICPQILDQSQLGLAAKGMVECLESLQMTDDLSAMELRFADGRLLVRPIKGAFVNVLCAKNVNLAVLNITLNLALRKLEQLLEEGAGRSTADATPTEAVKNSLQLRMARLENNDVGSSLDQLGMVAVSQGTARQISSFFGRNSKKYRIITPSSNGIFPVMIINDLAMQYDGALVVGPGVERRLKLENDDMLTIELA